MEHFIVSARKYRPKTFEDVVGQEAITNTLLNAIEHNHLAQALLFCGPRGVGKTSCARILAKKINQDGTENPDEDFAFNIFELDAASNNSVDDIRNLIDQVRIPPQTGNYKVYIIDEVHMLSQSAFNAFLKTLEEPPKHAIFILATTEKHKIIPTILSRCQIFDFKRITVTDAKNYLKKIAAQQGIEAEDDALHIIAQKADGAMRDALSIFDRVVSFAGNQLTRKAVAENLSVLDYDVYFEVTDLLLENNIPGVLLAFNNTLSRGFDGHHFITGLASHLRDLMVCKNESTIPLLEVGEHTQKRYLEQSRKTSLAFLLKAIELANETDLNYRNSKNQRLLVELCLMQIASITFDGEKKNESHFIVPASNFNGDAVIEKTVRIKEKSVEEPQEVKAQEKITVTNDPDEKISQAPVSVEIPKKNILKNGNQKVSGLSLSSISAKKQHELSKQVKEVNIDDLPSDKFEEEKMQQLWADYIQKIENEGKKIIASNLAADIPKLKNDTTLWIELPNDTMKKEVEREQHPLMEFLKKNLNNYNLELMITVNEVAAKKYAFTPMEKYEKLLEKNPLLDTLRKEFDLDV